MNLPRLLRTVRHLRPVQIYGRVLFRVPRPRVRWLHGVERAALRAAWTPSIEVERRFLGDGRFRLLGEERRVDSAAAWQSAHPEKLWLYNLHYFDDLRARDARERRGEHRALLERWEHENPPAHGVGWEPYPCSLRIVNWIKWALAGGELGGALEASLAVQAEHLSHRIEHHLQGNHLLANAKALAFAGLFFAGDAPRRWLASARALFERQLPEQILPDGGHCERSPMYHALVLEDLLDLINLARASGVDDALELGSLLEQYVRRMLDWLRCMTHPDGEISFFNDAALGMAAAPPELYQYADRLGVRGVRDALQPTEHLRSSGYVRAQRGPVTLFADVSELGLEHLTGHAHADTLSFELSVWGQRVIVNSGTSCYGSSRERLRQRATLAHNTVEIDGESSSEVWGGFRVGRRARPFGLEVHDGPEELNLRCSHDGYCHRRGRPVHERLWRLRDRALDIVDHIHGRFGFARASLHLAPSVRAELEPGARRGWICPPCGRRILLEIDGGIARAEAASYHPRFGQSIPTQVLRIHFTGPQCAVHLDWS